MLLLMVVCEYRLHFRAYTAKTSPHGTRPGISAENWTCEGHETPGLHPLDQALSCRSI